MKKIISNWLPMLCISIFVCIFFRETVFYGKLPVPSDTLVGMYHPWLDAIAKIYPSGLPYKNFLITDPIRQQIPWRKLAIDSIKKGNFNPWNAYTFSGTPLSVNIQSGFYYPMNILFLLLPFTLSWTILIVLQQLLSGIFMYIFLKYSMRSSNLAAVFGSVCFMLCGFSIVWLTWGTIGHTFLWLPLLLYLSDRLIIAKKIRFQIIISISLALILTFQYFAGHAQVFLYSSIVLASYTCFQFLRKPQMIISKQKIGLLFAGTIVMFLLFTSMHWVPYVTELRESSRIQNQDIMKDDGFFIPIQNSIQFVAPDFFGNPATLNYWGIWNYGEFSGYVSIAALLFILISLFSQKKSDIIFWFSIVILGSAFAYNTPLAKLPYQLHIPIFSSIQPTRLLSVIDFSLCVLSAIGFDVWMKHFRRRYYIVCLPIVAGIFIYIVYILRYNTFGIPAEQLLVARRNIFFPGAIFIAVCFVFILHEIVDVFSKGRYKIASIIAGACIIGITFIDLCRFGWKFTPFTDPVLFFPKTEIITYLQKQKPPYRITAVDDRIMPPNVTASYGIESIAGYDPIYNSRYETFIAAMERGEPNITPPFGFKRIITPKNISSPLFDLLGVRYVLSMSDISDTRFIKIIQEGQTRLYEYTQVLPRAYFVQTVEHIVDVQAIFRKFYDKNIQIRQLGIVEEELTIPSNPISETEYVHIESYDANHMRLSVYAKYPRLLYVGSLYHPGWMAYIDGKQIQILRVNYAFSGLSIPKGHHEIQLFYK